MNGKSLLDLKNLSNKPRELSALCRKIFTGGKSVRSQLICLTARRLKIPENDRRRLCRIVEYIHNSSLLHDDLIDHSSVRRRQKAAWLEFSPAQAVLAGDYLLAQVNIYLAEKGNLPLLRLTAESIVSLVKGEFLQREAIQKKNKSLKATDQISNLKTASLFKWSFKAPFLWKDEKRRPELLAVLENAGRNCGLLFQRSDDLLDFAVRNKESKPVLLDLKQNYLNSFACFLTAGQNPEFSARLRKAETLKDIHRIAPDFKNRLAAFDQLNEKLIQKTKKEMEKLKDFLKPQEQTLIEDFKTAPANLYYRKKNLLPK